MTQDIGLWLTALGAGAILREVVVAILNRRKVGVDAASVLSSAAADLVEPLRKELNAAREEAKQLRAALALALVDADALQACRRAREQDAARIRDLEARLG